MLNSVICLIVQCVDAVWIQAFYAKSNSMHKQAKRSLHYVDDSNRFFVNSSGDPEPIGTVRNVIQ